MMKMSTTGTEEISFKRRILFAIDDSESCKNAFNWYADRIMQPGDQITFVNVVEPDMKSRGASSSSKELGKNQNKTFDEVLNRSKSLGISYITMAKNFKLESSAFIRVDKKPGRAILSFAKHHNSNMIVMGSGGVGVFKRVFLGSVPDYVVHNSSIPVVIIHPESHS